MADPLRHRQTKGAETDLLSLPPPRHISTLPDSVDPRAYRESPVRGLCHEHHRSKRRCGTVREMKEGPSGSAIRSLIPSHRKLLWSKVTVVSVAETPGR